MCALAGGRAGGAATAVDAFEDGDVFAGDGEWGALLDEQEGPDAEAAPTGKGRHGGKRETIG